MISESHRNFEKKYLKYLSFGIHDPRVRRSPVRSVYIYILYSPRALPDANCTARWYFIFGSARQSVWSYNTSIIVPYIPCRCVHVDYHNIHNTTAVRGATDSVRCTRRAAADILYCTWRAGVRPRGEKLVKIAVQHGVFPHSSHPFTSGDVCYYYLIFFHPSVANINR